MIIGVGSLFLAFFISSLFILFRSGSSFKVNAYLRKVMSSHNSSQQPTSNQGEEMGETKAQIINDERDVLFSSSDYLDPRAYQSRFTCDNSMFPDDSPETIFSNRDEFRDRIFEVERERKERKAKKLSNKYVDVQVSTRDSMRLNNTLQSESYVAQERKKERKSSNNNSKKKKKREKELEKERIIRNAKKT